MKVLKFGGSSVGSPDNIRQVSIGTVLALTLGLGVSAISALYVAVSLLLILMMPIVIVFSLDHLSIREVSRSDGTLSSVVEQTGDACNSLSRTDGRLCPLRIVSA